MKTDLYLLVVGGVPGQIGEVNELHVEGPELSQDAAARRRPAPVTTYTAGPGGEGRVSRGEEKHSPSAQRNKVIKVLWTKYAVH